MNRIDIRKTSIYSILLLLVIAFNASCKKNLTWAYQQGQQQSNLKTTDMPLTDATPLDQLIVWIKPGVSRAKFLAWRDSLRNLKPGPQGAINIRQACSSCDSSLMLLDGEGIKTYIKGHTVSGGVGTSGTESEVSGDTSVVYSCLNYRVNKHRLPSQMLMNGVDLFPPAISGTSIKVAVFDTGEDQMEKQNYPFKSDSASCIPGADVGWNFVNSTNDYHDDDPDKHGSTVTRFITDQFGINGNKKVEILPVKTHDLTGAGNLLDILCGMAYAQQRGVKIINASFGWYLPALDTSIIPTSNYRTDPNVILLKKYVKHYLTEKGILLIAAAGNQDTDSKKLAFKENGMPYIPKNPQVINQVPFYPAFLAKDPEFPNVLAITTVFVDKLGNGTMSDQNYSNNVVGIGVVADTVLGTHYVFNNPRLPGNVAEEGSSFATPIAAGKIAANYGLIKNIIDSKSYTNEQLLSALSSVFEINTTLLNKIKGGRLMRKLK